MKTVMKFLSLLLCFELVISPVQGSLFLPAVALAETCPAGQAWSDSVGRCQVTAQTINDNNAVDNCSGMTEENAKACLEKVAKDKAALDSKTDNPFNGRGETKGGIAANAVAIGIPLLIVITVLSKQAAEKKKGKGFKCKPASLMLMYAAAATLAVGEIYGFFAHKSKLDNIQKKWDDSVVHKAGSGVDKRKTEATEAQSQAFEYLAQNEDLVASTAKTKKGFYLAATGLFAAGALAATVEMIKLKVAQNNIKVKGPLLMQKPETAAAGQTLINQGKETVRKITCNTGDNDGLTKKEYDKKEAKLNDGVKDSQDDLNNLNDKNKELKLEKPTPETFDPITGESNGDGRTQEDIDHDIKRNEKRIKNKTEENSKDTNKRDEWKTLKPKSSAIESPAAIEKMKHVAAYNLSTAKDAEQLLQLMNEMNSIELENYSKVNYLEEDMAQDLKKVPLLSEISKHIADAFLSSAHADDTGCSAADTGAADAAAAETAAEPENKDTFGKVLGIAGTALPLVLGLKSILGGVKSQGGVPLAEGAKEKIIEKTDGWLIKMIGKPVTRLSINGVLGGWMGLMSHHMDKQMRRSTERAAALRKLKEEFVASNGLLFCKEEDRSNSCKPICYCYTPDNRRNPDRAKDKVCMNAFAQMKYDPFGNKNDDKVCLDQNQRVDPKCACRAKKSCMKISSAYSMGGFSPATFRMMGTSSGPAQDLLDGSVSGGDVSDSAGFNAARIRAAADNMLAKADPKGFKDKNSFAASFEKGLLATGAGLSMGGSAASALPSSPVGAAAALDKELKEHKADKINTAGSTANGSGYSEDEEPEAVATEDATGEDIEIAEVMGKEVDTGDSDVNTSSHTNIFEVLSNRYQRSGMRRLFEENSTAPADAPSKTEIAD